MKLLHGKINSAYSLEEFKTHISAYAPALILTIVKDGVQMTVNLFFLTHVQLFMLK